MASGLSKLQAVNKMLRSIGEFPVQALDTGGSTDAAVAESVLDEVKLAVLGDGWNLNTAHNITLSRNSGNQIPIPTTALHIDSYGSFANSNYVRRGDYLYDLDNNTDVFTESVTVSIIYDMEWDQLPAKLKHYITCRAALQFCIEGPADDRMVQFLTAERDDALLDARREDARQRDANILNNRHSREVMGRQTAWPSIR